MANRKKLAVGYAFLCILYFAVSVVIPHEKLESRGLEGVGKASLLLSTGEITDESVVTMEYTTDAEPLDQMLFYFTADGAVLTEGSIVIEAYDTESGELIASDGFLLEDLGEEAFLGIEFEEAVEGGTALTFVITAGGVDEGPYIWLNTMSETGGASYEDGILLENNLIYNAVYLTDVHYVKQPFVTTLMLLVLGGLFFMMLWKRDTLHGVCTDGENAPDEVTDAPSAPLTDGKEKSAGRMKEKADVFFTRIKDFCLSRRKIIGLFGLVLIVALVFWYVYDVSIREAMNSTHREVVMKDNDELLPITEDSTDLVQYYICEEETLVGLGVRMDLSEDFAGVGTITAVVSDVTDSVDEEGGLEDVDGDGAEVLCSTEIDASTIVDGEYVGLIFSDSQEDTYGRIYEISLHFSDELIDSGLSVIVTPEGYYEDNILLINGEESAARLSLNAHTYFNIFLKKYFFAVFLFAELTAAGFYYLAFMRRARIEKVFLFTVICLGVMYNFIITPYMTPDESYHIDMTYRYSNELLGIDSAGENKCWKRQSDTEIEFTSSPSLENYKLIYDGLFEACGDASLVEADASSTTGAPVILYVPAILGMTLARVLGLGTVPMLLLARMCSLLFFAFAAYFAMKLMPFGKIVLFLLAVLPMNLQQVTSFSYDAVITGVIFLYICKCLSLAYDDRKERVEPFDILLLGILGIIMVYGKSGVYIPLVLIALLIPARKFGGRRTKWICMAGLIILPALCFINKNASTVSTIAVTTEATATVGSSTTASYTLGYLLGHPFELIEILANTLSDKTAFYLESLVGQKMGWVEIEISEVIPMLFWLLLILAALKTKNEPKYVTGAQKTGIVCICAMSTGIILAGMLLTWTPFGYVSIEGVQGRYFIPFMPALLLIARNDKLAWDENPERGLMYAGFIGEVLAIMYLIKGVLVL